MKFEKLNENKIRITMTSQELIEKNINFESFMTNSTETQSLFLDMLDEAEQKIGFKTKDHKIKIEALALADGDFVLTVTRLERKDNKDGLVQQKNKKVKVKRKIAKLDSDTLVYSFNDFDDFCAFAKLAGKLKNYTTIAKQVRLYTYKEKYYLELKLLNRANAQLKKISTMITEFGTYVNNSELFSHKLYERGKVILKHNAIRNCNKYFKEKEVN